ncbi:MAG: MATE family efflux transporter [Kiritimatiellae bacterium]|nr:MATE family efflux transporter [Kiritimatiellia bacterium]
MRILYPAALYKEVLHLAWPLIATQASFTLMLFFDRLLLARYSEVAIQAALPGGILSFTFCCGFMSVAGYTSTFVAQFFGAKNRAACSRSTAQGVLFTLFTAPILLLLIFPGRWLLMHAGHAPEVLASELPYFTILMLGCVAIPLNAAISSYFTGQGRTKITMVTTMLSNVVNLTLDYALIFGRLGFPEMGIRGAAIGTVIAGFISPAILFLLYFSKREQRLFQTRTTFGYDHRLFWRMIRFSVPAGIHLALDLASFSAFVLLTGRMGAVALASSNIALSINTLAFMPLIGFGIATSIIVGQYQGRRESERARQAAHAAFQVALLYMITTGVFFISIPDFFIGLFLRPDSAILAGEILPVGRILLIILTLWGLADAGNLIYASALKGAGDTRFVMIFSIAAAWLMLVPGQLVIIEWLNAGIVTAWCWTGLYVALLAFGFSVRFFQGRWKDINVIGHSTS